jgi:protein dithiol oxidoreductase (disulfide-forming)
MKLIKRCLRLATCLAALTLSAGVLAQPVAGRDYSRIDPPQPTDSGKKVEVIEFFYYGCPYCNDLQSPLGSWLKKKPSDVEFRRAPAVFQDTWVPLTTAYHALDAMGLVEKLHLDVFAAVHAQKIRLSSPAILFDWVEKKGVDRQKFINTYNSFGVRSRVQRSIEMTRLYDIPGTPALTVDGKFLVAPSMTLKADKSVDYERYFRVLDQVITQARKERAGK